jgi:hypothetical protein
MYSGGTGRVLYCTVTGYCDSTGTRARAVPRRATILKMYGTVQRARSVL